MKKLIILLLIAITTTTATAQNAVRTKDGNFVASTYIFKDSTGGQPTGKTFTDSKGIVYPVLKSKRNLYFYKRTSKNGNVYNCYLKFDANKTAL